MSFTSFIFFPLMSFYKKNVYFLLDFFWWKPSQILKQILLPVWTSHLLMQTDQDRCPLWNIWLGNPVVVGPDTFEIRILSENVGEESSQKEIHSWKPVPPGMSCLGLVPLWFAREESKEILGSCLSQVNENVKSLLIHVEWPRHLGTLMILAKLPPSLLCINQTKLH